MIELWNEFETRIISSKMGYIQTKKLKIKTKLCIFFIKKQI